MEFNREFVGDPNLFFNVTDERAAELEKECLEAVNEHIDTGDATNRSVLLTIIDFAKTEEEKYYLCFVAGSILEQVGAFN